MKHLLYSLVYSLFKSCILGLFVLLLSSCSTPSRSLEPKTLSKDQHFNALLDLASAALNEGDATSALGSLTEAETINKKSDHLHYLMALAFYNKGELGLATESARTAIKLNPKFSRAKNTLGKLLMDQGYSNEAEPYLKEAARDLVNQDAYIANTNLGILYYKRGQPDAAIKEFNLAIKANSEMSCVASFYRGKIYFGRDELFKAQSDFQKSSRGTCARYSDAHLELGKTFVRQKKYDQARAKLLEVQQLFPHTASAEGAETLIKDLP